MMPTSGRRALRCCSERAVQPREAGAGFSTELLRGSYQVAKAEKNLRVETGKLSDADVAAWVAR